MKKFLHKIAGVFFILLGIVGLVLPILQGWLFIFIGLSFLSPRLATRLRHFVLPYFARGPLLHFSEWNRFGVYSGVTTKRFQTHLASTDDLDGESVRRAVGLLGSSDPKKPAPNRYVYMKQVHGDRVVPVKNQDFEEGASFLKISSADALVTTERGTALLVLTADCLSIYYVAVKNKKPAAIGLAHAGWRGTRDQIALKTLRQVQAASGAELKNIHVLLGPSIDAHHYEVGNEFRGYFPSESLTQKQGRICFDLRKENQRQLITGGLTLEQMVDTGLSTVEMKHLFYSFRLEKASAGRMISLIYIP